MTSKLISNFKQMQQVKKLLPNQSQWKTIRELDILHRKLIQISTLGTMTADWPPKKAVPADVLHQLKGIYIWGSVGSGKSLLFDLFYNTLQEEGNIGTKRLHFHDLITWIHQELYLRRSTNQKGDLLRKMGEKWVSTAPVICIDEFFVRDIGEAMLIKGLFSGIWSAGGVLVATSNRPPQNLYEYGLNRNLFLPFIKQLEQRCSIINLSHDEDFRFKKTSSSIQCMFKDKERFKESFLAQIDGALAGPVTIEISHVSRSITVTAGRAKNTSSSKDLALRAKNTSSSKDLVVFADFEELCKSNKSVNDFRALMERSSLLYLGNVESIHANELNVARRFITLVDVAYEYKTRIIMHTLKGCNSISDILVHVAKQQEGDRLAVSETRVVNQGGSSSSAATTFIGETEWSATGLKDASLAAGGNVDTRFAVGRTISRLVEMQSTEWDPI